MADVAGKGRGLRGGGARAWVAAVTAAVMGAALVVGCAGKSTTRPGAATQPVRATDVDPATAEPQYWLRQPAVAQVKHADRDALWEAAEQTARRWMFRIDRRDYRGGLLTTEPMVSKQWFELWRKDAGGFDDVAEASLGPIRRSIHFEFTQEPNGTYSAAPKVLVERMSRVDERNVGMVARLDVPPVYWYALRRDEAMERELAEAMRSRLKQRQ